MSMYDVFDGEYMNLSTLTIFMIAYAGFLKYIEVSVSKLYVALILKTLIYDIILAAKWDWYICNTTKVWSRSVSVSYLVEV